MHLVHLTASSLFGGPERQMLGLADALAPAVRTTCISFREGGRCAAFVKETSARGHRAVELSNDTPHLLAATSEIASLIRSADVLLCHGYKANLLGRPAARRVRVPVVAVSRGWTWESLKVRGYEALDRVNLRFMDRVVAVSAGQAERVRCAGVPGHRTRIIRNAARLSAFEKPRGDDRDRLQSLVPGTGPLIVAAGRLSPEKGFAVLVEAAAQVPGARFVLFGDGPERARLESRIAALGLAKRFAMPGFTDSLDAMIPWADVVVLPSFTEGLPNVALEATAAGVPVVATAVGGTPEIVADGETGLLVPPGDPAALATALARLLGDAALRAAMSVAGKARVRAQFTFAAQANAYRALFAELGVGGRRVAA